MIVATPVNHLRTIFAALLTWALCFVQPAIAAEDAAAFREALTALTTNNFKAKEQAANTLAGVRHPGARAALDALLEGQLYYRREDQQVFIAKGGDDVLALIDPLTSQ